MCFCVCVDIVVLCVCCCYCVCFGNVRYSVRAHMRLFVFVSLCLILCSLCSVMCSCVFICAFCGYCVSFCVRICGMCVLSVYVDIVYIRCVFTFFILLFLCVDIRCYSLCRSVQRYCVLLCVCVVYVCV